MPAMIASVLPAVQTQRDHPDDSIFRALGLAIAYRLMRLEAESIRDEYRPSIENSYEPSDDDRRAYLEELSGGWGKGHIVDDPREIDGYAPGYCS